MEGIAPGGVAVGSQVPFQVARLTAVAELQKVATTDVAANALKLIQSALVVTQAQTGGLDVRA